jgi:hypothetical protein
VNAWLGLMAMLTCVTLVLTALRPGLAVSLVIFSASAAFGAYQLAASTAFVLRVRAPRCGAALCPCRTMKKLGPITRVPGTENG